MAEKESSWPWIGFKPVKKEHTGLSGAYTLTHVQTGKIYAGSSISIYDRLYKHIDELRRNIHGCKAMQELYNVDPVFEVFFYLSGINEEKEKAMTDCRDLEQQLLDSLSGSPLLLNTALDARASLKGVKFSQEHRCKIATALRGKPHSLERIQKSRNTRKNPDYLARMRMVNLGVKRSEDFKQKLRETRLKNSPKVKIDGVVYENTTDASQKLGIHKDTVVYRIKSQGFPNYSYD